MSVYTYTKGNEVSDVMIDVVHDWHAAGRSGDLVATLSGCMAPQTDASQWINQCIFELTVEQLVLGYNAFVITVDSNRRVFFNNIVEERVNESFIDNTTFFAKWYEGGADIKTLIVFEEENKGDGVYILTPRQIVNHDFSGLHSDIQIELDGWAFIYKTKTNRFIMPLDIDLFNAEEKAEFSVKGELIKI